MSAYGYTEIKLICRGQWFVVATGPDEMGGHAAHMGHDKCIQNFY